MPTKWGEPSTGQVATHRSRCGESPASEDQVVFSGVATPPTSVVEKVGEPLAQDQVVSSGQVATHRSRWWRKSDGSRTGGPGGSRQDGFGLDSVAEVGVSPTEIQVSDACQDGCQDGLRPERSPAVGPLSVAVRLGGPRQSYPAEGQVLGVPQACGGCHKSVACPESIDCCGSSHGKGTMGGLVVESSTFLHADPALVCYE